ncbi:unnamed protein product [Kuraishia capsulata CBS 1993]|uniref:Uncharacterized protein n=1 Tax=Kuraishia capsulata CBS 1993 TaxID=1382522 RepID=W6MR29_9ASCO|nr:uncharacterized protein KUCA_T00005176001 [Kuraishia capsulata CBS 1993]CDK29189.1 unnamed protein product [Kuraishia capsulata CBS 1993]
MFASLASSIGSSSGIRASELSSNSANSPDWLMDITISHPPTNSLSTYNCGIVGHCEYSLIPFLSSGSSRTLYAANFIGSTPCWPRTWMVALENPHCGASGVPFMNRTTFAEWTAWSMAFLVSSDKNLASSGFFQAVAKAGRVWGNFVSKPDKLLVGFGFQAVDNQTPL